MEDRRRTLLVELSLWGALAVPVLAVEWLHLHEPDSTWQQLTGIAALGAATALHRRLPATAFLLAAAPGLAVASSLFTLSYGGALAVFAYLMGLRSPAVRPSLLAFGALAVAGTVKISVRQVDPAAEWLVLMGTLLFGAVFPWLIGRYWRQSGELTAAGWARAEQLEREHRIVADRARLRERARIAQDMHDSLGHELSLIALRAGALQVAPGLADQHRDAAADLRSAASDATDRLHGIIGLLREEDDEQAPLAPPGETVAELVDRAAESGLPVHLVSAPGTDDNPRTEDRTVYRVVQEALTNAAKYAPGAPVTVEARQDATATTVTVTNARPADAPAAPSGSGTGLLGLRARITALGGSFDAGPHDGGFRVTARLPAPGTPLGGTPVDVDAGFGHARRTARRRVGLAFGAAAVAGTVLIGGAFTWYAYTKTHAVLTPQAYAQLRVGAPLADVESRLPERTISDPPVERAPTPPPAHADCRYYRASGELFVSVEHFRLCFADDTAHTLVDKAVIPKAGTADQVKEEEREWAR
ncbi:MULTISPECIES: histidine kinase [unclassified Streptomyces]|uniref:sensor histidine kinase n=1 Tax=unclassified Streptomyces TaxID=2593676 RepID=UPI002E19D598|nr:MULTISPECIES: histidine kinase [unclassified Streptomyces]